MGQDTVPDALPCNWRGGRCHVHARSTINDAGTGPRTPCPDGCCRCQRSSGHARRGDRSPHHDLVGQCAERATGAGRVAAPDRAAAARCQGAASLMLVLRPHCLAGPGRRGGVAAHPGLATRPLIRADDAVLACQGLTLPVPGVQVEDAPGFCGKLGVAGEEPLGHEWGDSGESIPLSGGAH